MEQKQKSPILYIAFGVALYAALMNFSSVISFLKNIVGLVFPIMLGLIFAFILSVPMRGFERLLRRLLSKAGRPPKNGVLHGISLGLTLLCLVFVIALAVTIVIPEFVASAKSIAPLVLVRENTNNKLMEQEACRNE